MKKPNNPPAFPTLHDREDGTINNGLNTHYLEGYEGMTLRDYAAIKAMQALISVNYYVQNDRPDVRYDYDDIAKEAGIYADAMLKEREEK